MSIVFRDMKSMPDSFSKMVDWIRHGNKDEKEADVFRNEGNGNGNGNGNGGTTWLAPTFKAFLDRDGSTIMENTDTSVDDGLTLGMYGTGEWDGNNNGYTIGTTDSISFTPADEWAYEIQETDADGKVNTVTVLPNMKYDNNTEGTTVSLLRVQTPSLTSSDGSTELGVMTLALANGSATTGDNVAKRGCADEDASNYDADVLVEDGSCEFSSWYEEVPTWGWVVGGVAVLGMVMGLRR